MLEKNREIPGRFFSNTGGTALNPLRWLLSSRCEWRLPVYGLILLIVGVIVGYAIGYNSGWENALRALNETLGS